MSSAGKGQMWDVHASNLLRPFREPFWGIQAGNLETFACQVFKERETLSVGGALNLLYLESGMGHDVSSSGLGLRW